MGAFTKITETKIESDLLIRRIGTERAPLVVDVRRRAAYDRAEAVLPAALWRDHLEAPAWGPGLRDQAGMREIVVYCAHGEQVSQAATSLLRRNGIPARALIGGIDAYAAAGGPLVAKTDNDRMVPSRWVIRERPTADPIACAWFIRRFVDPLAEIHMVEPDWIAAVADEIGGTTLEATSGDAPNDDQRLGFERLLDRYAITDPALWRLACIATGADTSRPDQPRKAVALESAGLQALSLGLSTSDLSDDTVLERGFALYDALYDWARFAAANTDGWRRSAGATS